MNEAPQADKAEKTSEKDGLPNISNCVGCPNFHLNISDILACWCSDKDVNKAAGARRGQHALCLTALDYCNRKKDGNNACKK